VTDTDHDLDLPIGGGGGFPDELSVEQADDRYILKLGEITDADRERIAGAGLEIVHALEHVGFVVVRGEESAVEETGYEYVADLEFQR